MYPIDESPVQKGLQSSYWKIDYGSPLNPYEFLNCMDVSQGLAAVGSSACLQNVKIFKLDTEKNLLGYLASFSAPNVCCVNWLHNVLDETNDLNLMMTGHTNGIANLSLIPNVRSANMTHVDLIKQFNHRKHTSLTDIGDDFQVEISPKSWKSCMTNSMMSIYKENIFLWDTSRSSSPLYKNKAHGIKSFAASENNDGLVAFAGSFGVRLFDMRSATQRELCTSTYLSYKHTKTRIIEWSPQNPYQLCAAGEDSSIQLWDIRKQQPLATMGGHSSTITAIEWVSENSIFTGAKDGRIVHWNMKDVVFRDSPVKCSVGGKDYESYQCGTSIESSKTGIVSLKSSNGKLISLDDSYMGLHHESVQQSARKPSNHSDVTLVEQAPLDKLMRQLDLCIDGIETYI
ncbi:hypothetical protein KL942_000209 [Ogataea angusta]|uniref:Uncharacterized protein n=1 Tax=Pichia angusta TaxID=870730 RepID=A0AAN6I7G9_PICAN|nr:uncharacterized protein KL928_001005 [Ogataea angusta]KAG7820921.1 hypothetical protein KL928_001005 [Ogataea angusta]KAG7826379.1 hypothetical protein KL909_000431 [Ogataea angusta]KAG7831875.1 hypothetical protein KL920_000210 [Ogataea angusta]KAG7836048.1 hypothetical protein KL943_001697 [Ogataea angusta]KAG7843113.1 hypothetical protein KL942_000209 [Ogataea angusta]